VTDPIDRALDEIKFDPDGLIPAIAQQHDTGEVLMMAWMSRESVRITLAEGRACYWSRSRQALRRKGETSGQLQRLKELRLDCDGDALFRQSSGPVFGELSAATDRYGARVQDYNTRCAGRPMDPGLVAQAQATRACPPLY